MGGEAVSSLTQLFLQRTLMEPERETLCRSLATSGEKADVQPGLGQPEKWGGRNQDKSGRKEVTHLFFSR